MRTLVLASALALLAAGCAPPDPAPPSGPAPVPSAPSDAAPPTTTATEALRICVVEGDSLAEVEAAYDRRTGDTLVAGRPFSDAYPVTRAYARDHAWYVNNEPFEIERVCYGKYGVPRYLPPSAVKRVGEYHGVGVYAEVDDPGPHHEVALLPVWPGCWFQQYQYELIMRPCRSDAR